jgi:hypothetical protein
MDWACESPRAVSAWLSRVSDILATAFAAAAIGGLFAVHLFSALAAQHFTPFSLVEETAYTLISAQNFLKYGFFNSTLLQDFSTSEDASDHPYVYDHMPPGPDITEALVLKLTSGSFETSRIVFSLSALFGFLVYYLFVRKFLGRFGLRGAGIALLIPGAWQIIQLYERQIYSPFCILCFLPLYLYLRFLEDGKTWRLLVASALAFLSSIYLEYTVLAAISACWFGFFATRLIPIRVSHFVLIAASILLGIVLHLTQNLVHLGWTNFAAELKNTLSNRITGHPSAESLQGFYRSIGVLHHGAHPVDPHALLAQVRWNFDFVGANQIGLMLLCSLFVMLGIWLLRSRQAADMPTGVDGRTLRRSMLHDVMFLCRIVIWVAISVVASILLFPAFSQEVTVRGSVGPFFFGIGVAAVFDFSLRLVASSCATFFTTLLLPSSGSWLRIEAAPAAGQGALRVVCVTAILLATGISLRSTVSFATTTANSFRSNWSMISSNATAFGPPYDLLSDLHRYGGELFMTNINAPAVGLFTGSVVFGVCAPESVQHDGTLNLESCKTLMARQYDYWQSRRPHYFMFTDDRRLFPGFADCLPANTYVGQARREASCMDDLLSRLTSQYRLVMKNDLFRVFDLSLPANSAG